MTSTPARKRGLSLGVKLSLILILLTTVALVGLIAVVASMTTRAFDEKGEEEMVARTSQLVTSIDLFQRGLREAAVPLNAMFAELYPEKFSLDAMRSIDINGTPTPVLLHGRQPVNLEFSVVDRFTRATGGVATVFARKGDDFVRVATSLKKENGERAVGTLLGSAHPAYARMLAGEPYVGRATLFGREFMTRYLPIRSESGQVIAILFTARDFTDGLKLLQETIAKEKVGHTGYFYVVDTRSGPGFGNFVIHPTLVGKSALELKDATTGQPFVKAMIERKRGRVDYTTAVGADAASGAQPKIAVFDHYPEWGWLVAGTVLRDDFTHDSDDLRNRLVWMALGLILLLAAATTFAVRTMVRRPLAEAADVTARVADGDLTSAIRVHSSDEVGRMLEGLDQMQRKLRHIVGGIHGSAEAISAASQQIAAGNGDLAQRTETQAASLEQTASSMEELATTVQQNAESARQANVVASEATEIATRGGAVVAEVIGTMDEISASSKKIADIIGVIDGIAFQTNILALNAAVEAARAGEQGRGFAVVAAEVRSLAQRSAAAAREIKELIGASVASVDSGAKRVEAAGSTIDEVVRAVRRVAGIVAEIATASQQQAAGIVEVHGAITEMDETTRQNAALVEEAAAAASALEEQAQALVREMATFKTGELPPATRAAAEIVERARSASRKTVRPASGTRPAALLPGRSARTQQNAGDGSADWPQT